jgi:ribosomal protein L7/L12
MSDEEIQHLIAAGNKIAAIRLYRERYGGGLKEAKEAVDALAAGQPVPPPRPRAGTAEAMSDEEFHRAIDDLIREGKQINAIKLYRDRCQVGLKEAKDIIDARAAELGAGGGSGCVVATAAWGSDAAPEVQALRRYRDTVLAQSFAGRRLIQCYQRVWPPLAAALARSERARRCARALLWPAVYFCRQALRRM